MVRWGCTTIAPAPAASGVPAAPAAPAASTRRARCNRRHDRPVRLPVAFGGAGFGGHSQREVGRRDHNLGRGGGRAVAAGHRVQGTT